MSTQTLLDKPSGPDQPARPLVVTRKRIGRRLWVDRLARRVISLGGGAIIISILAIFLVIAGAVYPLLKPPTATAIATIATGAAAQPLAVAVDEYREVACLVTEGGVEFYSLKDGTAIESPPLAALGDAKVVGTAALGRGPFALGLSDGRVLPLEVNFNVAYADDGRTVQPDLAAGEPIKISPDGHAIRTLAHVVTPGGPVTAAAIGPRDVAIIAVKERKALIGGTTREQLRQDIALPLHGEITAAILDGRGDDLFVGTSEGEVLRVDLREPAEPQPGRVVQATSRSKAAVTALGFLIGDRTIVVGDAAGGVSSWQLLLDEAGNRVLSKIYDFQAHGGPVVLFAPSRRDKGFVTADASGTVHLHYGTTGEHLLTVQADAAAPRGLTFAPKADGIALADRAGKLSHWSLANPHPEVTWRGLFGKVWYEGYDKPEFVWQSTGGTDDFEAKLSLTPLLYGTMKGTFYALLIAVPLALSGAIYASQFMHPSLKGIVKPTVEIMAALPSVVLGFIAGLWLAPRVEQVVPGLFLLPIVVPLLILLTLIAWHWVPLALPVPHGVRAKIKSGTEVFLLVPVVLLGAWLAFYLGGLVEATLLAGDYRNWLIEALGLTYDQRNSLVVGFAMGFAVIPIIFTIAEDSLSNVPQHLTAGSLALGATRWQTAIRVVLPTASPGIFSAIMIGFGRAVGETMIVLMATGNTPVMDWSIFNGFRALSANIAVELPEAPEGGTLYRVLFLAALLLFAMTFLINTAAELVRLRLRKKYRYL